MPSQSTQAAGDDDVSETLDNLSLPDGYPQVFGKYVLVRPMARGGMGELFIAVAGETGGFEKLCVVKKVLHSLADAAVHRRFLDEAKVVVRLNHANLVQVFDAGRVDNEYYLAMELVEGKDLRAVWNRCAQLHRRIPVDVAIFVIREVLRGLEYVHDVGKLDLVHRDISPPNLLVGYRGDVKLTDFGLAKSAIKREMTSPGVVFGRYSYLSPEQARGLPADRRTDIYACAIVLWELLTGRQLFPSSNRSHQEALEAVRNPKAKAPSGLVPGVPDGLDAIVLKGLARDRDQRYATAGEFRAGLSEVLSSSFPSCDADRVSEFMRDIFAREHRLEQRDYLDVSRQDFSEIRANAEDSELISISDVLNRTGPERSEIELRDSDIVELDKGPGPRWDERPDAASLKEAAQAWVKKVVAQRYRIDQLIGIGGMGAVFRATHLALGKPFALKVLHSVYTRDSEIITRFMREARAATQTGHPNIIDVLDIGTTDEGDVYFVMELLEGINLGKTIENEGPLAVRRAVHIARQVSRALAAAHTAGIIHRDLKSENIILTTRGKDPDFVKVLDFGICKQENADGKTTSPGLIMGSPDYMAPEQGAGLDATVASDIYAVGCIMFEMLTGKLPFSGRNAVDVLMQKGAREAQRVTELRPEIPEALSEVIARCLRRASDERPPSMRSLEYELTRAVDGRATAVAAVLGIGEGEGRTDDPRPDASASMHRAAIASIGAGGVYGPDYQRQEKTQIAPAPLPGGANTGPVVAVPVRPGQTQRPMSGPQPTVKRPATSAAAARAAAFTLLGGALAFGLLAIVTPGGIGGLFADKSPPRTAKEAPKAKADPPPQPTKADPKPSPEEAKAGDPPEAEVDPAPEVEPEPEIVEQDDDGGEEVIEVAPPSIEKMGPEELVALGDELAGSKAWLEPSDRNLALVVSKLVIVDPGNEAIRNFRQAAADDLLPTAQKALDKKKWTEAAAAFRALNRIWPTHPEAREGLIESLTGEARVRSSRKYKDYEAALATVNELLTMQPDDPRVLTMQGDILDKLGRYAESRDAYKVARRYNRRSKPLKEKYLKAVKKARKAKSASG